MKPIRLGDVEIRRVVEIPRSTYPTSDMLPTSSAEVIARHRSGWLGRFYDADTGDLGSRIQSYVVRTPDEIVLIDACVGNDKRRENALWNMRQGRGAGRRRLRPVHAHARGPRRLEHAARNS